MPVSFPSGTRVAWAIFPAFIPLAVILMSSLCSSTSPAGLTQADRPPATMISARHSFAFIDDHLAWEAPMQQSPFHYKSLLGSHHSEQRFLCPAVLGVFVSRSAVLAGGVKNARPHLHSWNRAVDHGRRDGEGSPGGGLRGTERNGADAELEKTIAAEKQRTDRAEAELLALRQSRSRQALQRFRSPFSRR
ncbi:hypothetical protein D3C85_1225280 [compost metagenome]